MSEEWRRKTFYASRVLIPVEEVLNSAFGDCLVCLTGGQLNLIRNLLQYADRRSTFVSEYHERYYLAPTTEEWDALQAVVAELERNMMNCEQFSADLAELLSRVRSLTSLTPGAWPVGAEEAFPYDDTVGDDELTPAEAEACAIAQLWFEWGYQVITEHVLPATRWGFDYMVPAVAAFIAGAIGGPPAALGVYAVAELIQELLEILYDGAETNLVNWMTTNKKAIVCSLWPDLVVGGDASDIWAITKAAIIDTAEDISAGDKLILHLFMGSWAGSNAERAFTAVTEWATSNVIEDYCLDCPYLWDIDWDYIFPPCPQDWYLHPTYAFCNEGYIDARASGECMSPSLAGMATGHWAVTCYVKFRSTYLSSGTRCATMYLQYWTGSFWDSTGSFAIPLISGGPNVWVEVSEYKPDWVPARSLWRLRLWPFGAGSPGQVQLQRGRVTAMQL